MTAAYILGQALLKQERAGEAIAPLERAARRVEDPRLETSLGVALIWCGQKSKGLELLERATTRRPAFAPAFVELGRELGDAARLDEAVTILERGLALAPDDASLRISLAQVHIRRRALNEARKALEEVLARHPNRVDAIAAMATVASLEGDCSAAADLLRRAVALRPHDAQLRIALGKCLLNLGAREAGEAILRAVARGDPQYVGLISVVLCSTSHGRFFLRHSAADDFLRKTG